MDNSDKKNIMIFIVIVIAFILVTVGLVAVFGQTNKNSTDTTANNSFNCNDLKYTRDNSSDPIAQMNTDKGCVVLELYKSDAPKTVDNFEQLSKKGYYNNLTFHRVLKGFVIQGGDPNGNGTGGQSAFGKPFEDELNTSTKSYQTGYVKGILAMANSGPNTNGSQFFITVADLSQSLPKNYTIFGKVIAGQDVVDQISLAPTVDNGQGEQSKPVTPVKIKGINIVE